MFSNSNCPAATKSASAFRTHSAVSRFVQHFSFRRYLSKKRIALREAPAGGLGRADDDVQRKRRVDVEADAAGLIELISSRHDDQNVDVAVVMRRAVSMRSEQNDLVGLKTLCDLAREVLDHGNRNIRATVVAGQRRCSQVWTPVRAHRSLLYLSGKIVGVRQ